MTTRRQSLGMLTALMGATLPRWAVAQSGYPSSTVEFIVSFNPGGGVDLFARTLARVLNTEGIVPATIQVSNLPGAGGALGMAEMVKRSGDAHSFATFSAHVYLAQLTQGTPHTWRDMTSVAKVVAQDNYMIVRTESPIQSLKDVADALREDTSRLTFAGASLGNSDQITVCKLAEAVGADPTKVTYIPYSGGDAVPAVLGGHVDVGVRGPEIMEFVEAGKLRVLGITARQRREGRSKDLPTFREQGYDVLQTNWLGVFAPPNLPADVLDYWVNAITAMTETDAWKGELSKNQWANELQTGQPFLDSLAAEYDEYKNLLTRLGIIK